MCSLMSTFLQLTTVTCSHVYRAKMSSYGVHDSPCPSPHLSPFENKIGGHPDCYKDCLLSKAPGCGSCHAPMVLLVQIYCPLEGSLYHRLLHIFCCTQLTCWGKSESWLVLRSQSLAVTTPSSKDHLDSDKGVGVKTAAVDWCDSADDWENDLAEDLEDGGLSEMREDFKALLIQPNTCHKGESVEKQNEDQIIAVLDKESGQSGMETAYEGPSYPAAYIRTVEEGDIATSDTSLVTKATKLLEKYQAENPNSLSISDTLGSGGRKKGKGGSSKRGDTAGGSEMYEKATARHGDKMFLKFQKELSKCPQQIIRYNWKGVPVLISGERNSEILQGAKLCSACGAECVFECQLMPPLVYVLQTYLCLHHDQTEETSCSSTRRNEQLRAVEFGTVIVLSCSASCWKEKTEEGLAHSIDNFKREMVFVQSESTKCLNT